MNRSYLMVAGDKQKHLDKLRSLKCDVAMINLEDGVFDKEFARELLTKNFLDSSMRFDNLKTVVRVNALDECADKDIEVMDEFWGRPFVVNIEQFYRMNNSILSAQARNHGVLSAPKYVAPEGSVDKQSLNNDFGLIQYRGSVAPQVLFLLAYLTSP